MAKSKPVKVKVTFESAYHNRNLIIDNVLFKSIPYRPGQSNFMHLEQKGNAWLLLHTDGFIWENEVKEGSIEIHHQESDKKNRTLPSFILPDGRPLLVSRYTQLTPFNFANFYHIDQLPDYTHRLTHNTKLFPVENYHENIDRITLTIVAS